MSPELMAKVTEAANRTGQKQAEILRMCLEIGIEDLRACGYNLPKLVADTARALRVYAPSPKPVTFPDLSHSLRDNVFELPFLGAVAAGEPVEAPRDELLPVAKEFPPGYFIVEVNGASMEPDYPDGSRWIIDGRDKFTPKHGAVCVVSDGSGSYLKRWNKRAKQFESINPAFNQIIPSSEAKLQGYPVERYAAP